MRQRKKQRMYNAGYGGGSWAGPEGRELRPGLGHGVGGPEGRELWLSALKRREMCDGF